MFKKLKDIFGSNSTKIDNHNFIVYDQHSVNRFKEKYKNKIDMTEIHIPELESNERVKIIKWFKNDGDKIKKKDRLCLLEGSKYTMELESFVDGYLYYRQQPEMVLNKNHVICLILSKAI